LTLGLYNCYDPKQWHEIMRITLARAAPVAVAFGCELAAFGFPFEQARARGAKRSAPLRTPQEVARFVADGTGQGEGGERLVGLAEQGRFHLVPFEDGFPKAMGRLVATTPHPDPGRATTPFEVAKDLAAGHAELLLVGLGPRGLPDAVMASAAHHLELTGQGVSLETATALGALPAALAAHLQHLGRPVLR
jgi:hypothetical protein